MTTEEVFAKIVQWGSHELPEALDALVVPEDTYCILQAATEELDPHTTPLDLWASLERAVRTEKRPLGSVIITAGERRGVKHIGSVVVYDFEAEPICRKDIVLAALRAALRELATRGCRAVGVYPLGTMRGGISQEEYSAVVNAAVLSVDEARVGTVYLLAPDADAKAAVDLGD